jgi:Mn2+/Fe2+ NRAMP family transporter
MKLHRAKASSATPHRGQGGGDALRAIADEKHVSLSDVPSVVGPGIITGGADNDPAGVVTYSLVGAQNGYSQNFLMVIATPILIGIQQMCARIGNVTKSDLIAVIRTQYGTKVAAAAAVATAIANVITIGADLVMMAAVIGLITTVDYIYFVVPLAAVMAYVTIFLDYRVVRKYLLWLAAVFAVYIAAAFLAHPDWGSALTQIVAPHISLNATYFLGAVSLLGTTITPYLFFWQTNAELEERRGVQGISRANLDIASGMIWSSITGLAIIIASAAVLNGQHQNSQSLTAADIANALGPVAGSYAKYLFALGIVGSGLLAIPVLAISTSYVLSSVFGWRRRLNRPVREAPQFYLIIGIALLLGVQLAISKVNPLKALFYSQALDGLIAPFLVLLILLLSSSRKVMGDFVNGRWTQCMGILGIVVLAGADVALIFEVARSGLP